MVEQNAETMKVALGDENSYQYGNFMRELGAVSARVYRPLL